jgi:hypothetical protein
MDVEEDEAIPKQVTGQVLDDFSRSHGEEDDPSG